MTNKTELPDGVEKLPPGVELRSGTLRVNFVYKGQRCREPLKQIKKITKGNIEYAGKLAEMVKAEIKAGSFVYKKHFPESPRAMKHYAGHDVDLKRTVGQAVDLYLEIYKLDHQTSGWSKLRSKGDHIKKYFGVDRQLRSIVKTEIETFKAALIDPTGEHKLGPKTANAVLGVLRKVYDDALDDFVVEVNIARRVKAFKIKKGRGENADPFTRQEITTLESLNYYRPQDQNMFMFNTWCGLSVSELRALAWQDIDLDNGFVHVRRVEVEGEIKCPKTGQRERKIELLEPALYWLRKQKPFTYNNEPVEVLVTQEDSNVKKTERITYVFMNDQTRQNNKKPVRYTQSSMERWFKIFVETAGIRPRGPNQCRHTFASQALSKYVPLEWVARQLGHSDIQMLKEHYGAWIPDDAKPMAKIIGEMMGVDGKYEEEEQKPERNTEGVRAV